MNKLIINGIDVSECCCFENNRCLWSKRYYENNNVAPLCEAVKNCYFKQLKRLQKENEELKENVEILQNQIIQEHEQYNNLTHDSIDDLKTIRTYKQALEEIKKWATNHNPCDIEAGINCTKEDCFECLNYDIKKITTIIDEVLK